MFTIQWQPQYNVKKGDQFFPKHWQRCLSSPLFSLDPRPSWSHVAMQSARTSQPLSGTGEAFGGHPLRKQPGRICRGVGEIGLWRQLAKHPEIYILYSNIGTSRGGTLLWFWNLIKLIFWLSDDVEKKIVKFMFSK